MADFSFLNDDQQDQGTLPPAKGYVPEGWQKRQPGNDYWENDETETSPGDELRPRDTRPSEPSPSKPNKTGDFQQKRAKAADFAKSEAFKAVDRLGAVAGGTRPGGYQFDPERTKAELLTKDPSQYAEHVYQLAKNLNGVQAGTGTPLFDENSLMRPVEDAVSAYKQLQLENQSTAQQIQGQMTAADAANAQAQMQSLNSTIEQTKQRMAVSATSRQRDELKQNLDFYESQKRVLQSKIPQQATGAGDEIQDKEVTIDHALTAAGHPRGDAVQALTEMRRIVGMAGISISAPVSPLSFIPTYTNLISHIFNPQVRDRMLDELAPQQDEQKQQERQPQKSTFGSDKLEQDPRFLHNQQLINDREQRQQKIMRELANSGTFKNVADVLGFVLTSFLLGPRAATLFFSNMQKNGNLRQELDRLDRETTQLYHQQNSYIQLAQHARSMAAGEEHQKAMEAENARHHWAVESYMKMKGGDKSAFTPDEKKTDLALQHSFRFAKSNLDTQQQKVKDMDAILQNPMHPEFKMAKANISKERAKLYQMKSDFDAWKNKVNEWYRQHGAGDIEAVNAPKGDSFTMPRE